MKFLGLWFLFLVALLLLSRTSREAFSNSGAETTSDFEDARSFIISRTLQDIRRDLDPINVEDYPRYDPAPSSKAAIKSGPIEHGSPLMPHIPPPTPPNHPKHGSP